MVHRVQRHTTQRIPTATIEGLEPKRVEPRPAPRIAPGGFKPAGKTFSKKTTVRPWSDSGRGDGCVDKVKEARPPSRVVTSGRRVRRGPQCARCPDCAASAAQRHRQQERIWPN